MQLMSSGGGRVKEQVAHNIPKRFQELQFGVQYVELHALHLFQARATHCDIGPLKISSIKLSLKFQTACYTMWTEIENQSQTAL
jgi:hypothetical protein